MVFDSHLSSENSKENGCPVEQEPPFIVLLFGIFPFCLLDFFFSCVQFGHRRNLGSGKVT